MAPEPVPEPRPVRALQLPLTAAAQPVPAPPGPPVRARSLLWPTAAFVALMVLPPGAGIVAVGLAVAGRMLWRASEQRRARRAEIRALAAEGPSIVIGVDADGRPVTIPERTLAAHGLIVGATGAGKSTTLLTLLTDQIARGRPVVAIDLKGSREFSDHLRAAAEAAGRPFLEWTPDGATHWNPLAAGNTTELKDKLLGTERFTEPHYRRAAERYLQTAIQVALEVSPGEELSLARVVDLMSPPRLIAAARDASPQMRDRVRDYLSSLTPDQVSAVRGLGSRLAVLSESDSGPLLEPGPPEGTLDLRRALRGGEVVLFSLNSSRYGGLASMLGTLAVQDLTAAAGARLDEPVASRPRAVVAIDEFSALGSDNVLALLVRGREAGVGVLLATQELADLTRSGAGVREQILGNTALKIAHRQDVPESARAVAGLTGIVRAWERSYQHRSSAAGVVGSTTVSDRLVDRYRVDPEQIGTMHTGEAVVVIKAPVPRTTVTRIRREPPAAGADAGR